MAPSVCGTQNWHLGLFLQLDFNQYSRVLKGFGKMTRDPTFEDKDENILPCSEASAPTCPGGNTCSLGPCRPAQTPGRQYAGLRTLARTLARCVHWTRLLPWDSVSTSVTWSHNGAEETGQRSATKHGVGAPPEAASGAGCAPQTAGAQDTGCLLCFHSPPSWGCRKELAGLANAL